MALIQNFTFAHVYCFYFTRGTYFEVQKPFQKDTLIYNAIKTKSCCKPVRKCSLQVLGLNWPKMEFLMPGGRHVTPLGLRLNS